MQMLDMFVDDTQCTTGAALFHRLMHELILVLQMSGTDVQQFAQLRQRDRDILLVLAIHPAEGTQRLAHIDAQCLVDR